MFAYNTCVKTDSCREVCRQFTEKFPGIPVPHRNMVRKLVVKVRETRSFHDRTRKGKKIILMEEKVVEIGESLQRTPTKSLRRVA
ncbi:hypothetical protein C0J52_19935 [Blattella germanica]|nr:hypothetical protein C0J52_19935 [Blattella germanica]